VGEGSWGEKLRYLVANLGTTRVVNECAMRLFVHRVLAFVSHGELCFVQQ